MSFELPETKAHGWIRADTPKGSAVGARRLGTGKGSRDGKPMPMPDDTALRATAHARCAEHVRVEGLREKVCVAVDRDRDAVIAEARELAGLA